MPGKTGFLGELRLWFQSRNHFNLSGGIMMSNAQSDCQERHVLVINDGKRRAIALEAAAYSVGRDPSNAIVIDVDTISRQHAMFLRVPVPGTNQYRYRVIDGNSGGKPSANGVFINDQKVSSRDLTQGDVIRFGQTIEVSYLTVSMGTAEFAQYLESISYQSIKSDIVNAKETLVGACFMDEEPPATTIATMLPQTVTTHQRVKDVSLSETLHELSNETVSRRRPLQIVVPGVLLALGSLVGLWMLTSQSRPSQSSAETIPSDTQQSVPK
ncbi:FHA domain-containing protein [Altericista sp. CCNU0014]|uniref:FHA domain-containing protein n=1 Tax=Altericista sp. CCNU0014 TaxID=3082949 RepID=UPI00384CFB1F